MKIIQHAHPATNIPTINNSRGWDANEEEGRAAVLGFVIDEEHQRALIREISISQDDLNRKGELIRLVESADDKSLVSAAIGHLVAAIKTPGPLNRKHFNRFNVIDGTGAPECDGSVMRIDRVCMLLRDTEFALRKKASKAITSELENGNPQPDIKSTTKMLSLLSRLYSVFDNIRSCSPTSDKVITSNVVHEANGVRRIDLCWMQRLPDVVSCAPLLIIDATADEKISRLPLAGRDAFYGEDVGKEIEFKRIKVDAPHMTLVKVIDAPYTKTALKPKAHEITVGEDGEHVARRALHGNSSLASVLRVADAICGRTVADGGTTGLITFKAVREDITERGADEDLILGHLGKTRGLNCMENTSSIFIAGRIALGIDKLEKLTCAIFGLDPEGEEPTLGLGMNYRAEAVLRARGADGRSLGNGLSIRTEAPRCRVVKRVSEWITLAEELQAIHRGRGVRRTAADPVLVVVMSNVVGDITCDHVVTWDAFANMRALDALMHSAGVVNRRPAHLKALKPQLFQWLGTDAVIAWDLFNAWDVTKMSKHRKSLIENPKYPALLLSKGISDVSTSVVTRLPRTARSPLFTADTVLHGNPAAHPLLKPAQVTTARYKPGRVEYECFIDQNRRAPASAAQLLATGVDLLPEGAPPADTPKPAPMTAAERQRKRRAALKAAKEAKDTKENSNARSTGRNGHQDAAEGKAEAPKPNSPTGARKAPPQGIRPSSRKARKTASCQAKQGRALPTSPPGTVESEKLMRCV